jgi:hypothetical protein
VRINVSVGKAEELLKRMFFLAYKACGAAQGMGVLQEARLGAVPATEAQVWDALLAQSDYSGSFRSVNMDKPIYGQSVHGDYVIGRMIKWGGRVESKDVLAVPDLEGKMTLDYHAWAHRYPTTGALLDAASKELEVTYSVQAE